MAQKRKLSTPSLLSSLEAVAKTRTSIFGGVYGDVHIKLDTDVNDQEWYVVVDDTGLCSTFKGEVPCWAFPHFNGAHDFYRYVPVPFCFKTFASLLEAYPQYTECKEWFYDEIEYAERLERANWKPEQIDSSDEEIEDNHSELIERMKLWGIEHVPLQGSLHLVTTGAEEKQKPNCDKCPGVNSHRDRSELCEECAKELDAFDQMAWDVSTVKRELDIQFKSDVRMVRNFIKRLAFSYGIFTDRYPTWQYADTTAKKLAETNWEDLFREECRYDLANHPF